MTKVLNAARIVVAAVSLIAILGAPFVVMHTQPTSASAGYGIIDQQIDQAQISADQAKA